MPLKSPSGLFGLAALLMLGILMLSACYYDKADIVYPPSAPCDSTNVTYSNTVVPILTARCYACHSGTASAGGGIKLDSYNAVLVQVNNGRLLGSIEQRPGFSPMPKGSPKMPECEIAKIRVWINAGAPNN
jgi:hypothetical protein